MASSPYKEHVSLFYILIQLIVILKQKFELLWYSECMQFLKKPTTQLHINILLN